MTGHPARMANCATPAGKCRLLAEERDGDAARVRSINQQDEHFLTLQDAIHLAQGAGILDRDGAHAELPPHLCHPCVQFGR